MKIRETLQTQKSVFRTKTSQFLNTKVRRKNQKRHSIPRSRIIFMLKKMYQLLKAGVRTSTQNTIMTTIRLERAPIIAIRGKDPVIIPKYPPMTLIS